MRASRSPASSPTIRSRASKAPRPERTSGWSRPSSPARASSGRRFRRSIARALLGRLHRLQARRDRTQRHRLRADQRHLPQPREGARSRSRSMPLFTPFGAWTSFFGAQGNHQQLDTSGEALLFPARTPVRRRLLVQRDRALADHAFAARGPHRATSRSTAPRSISRPNFLPPPDDPDASPARVSFAPKSVSYSLLQDLPSVHGREPEPAAHRARAAGARAVRQGAARCHPDVRHRQSRT